MNKDNYGGLDIFRPIAAILVIAIHTSPLEFISPGADFFFTRLLARVAVPFFFMVTGQFVLGNVMYRKDNPIKIKRFIIKTAITYLAAIAVFLPFGLYLGHYKGFSFGMLLKMLFFDGTFYHLWYLPACIWGVLAVTLLSRFLKPNAVIAITSVLYIIGVFGDSWYGAIEKIPVITDIYNGFFAVSSYTRNGIFFAPLFLALGAVLGQRKKRPKAYPSLVMFLISLIFMSVEGFTAALAGLQRHDSMYFFLPVLMFFLYRLLLSGSLPSRPGLRRISMLVYILHPIVIMGVREMGRLFRITPVLVGNGIVHFILVSIISFVGAGIIFVLYPKLKNRIFRKKIKTSS